MQTAGLFHRFLKSPAFRHTIRLLRLTWLPLYGLFWLIWSAKLHQGWINPRNFIAPLQPIALLPIPPAFALWVHVMEREKPFSHYFSPAMLMLSMAAFSTSIVLQWLGWDATCITAAAIGVVAGCCISINMRDICRQAVRHPHETAIALTAGLCSILYFTTTRLLWQRMCAVMAWGVYALCKLMGMTIAYSSGQPWAEKEAYAVEIGTPQFSLFISPTCSGLEGIFMFFFLLSAVLMLDWPLFRQKHVSLLYIIGFFYMSTVNVLRISALMLLGVWAWQPDASPFARSLRYTPLHTFHSHVGWIMYLLAFSLFLAVLYKRSAKTPSLRGGQRPTKQSS